MNYKLQLSSKKDMDILIQYKLNNILSYVNELSNEEMNEINEYVKDSVSKQIDKYKLIYINGKKCGCVLVEDKDDGVIIDEIYIEKEYRNNKIGTDLIKKIISNNKVVYLWVYKTNSKAINLYKRLGFIIIKETKNRYYMRYSFDD